MAEISFYANLAADAQLRHTPGGSPVLSFRAGESHGKKQADGSFSDEGTTWFNVSVWGSLAEMLFERELLKGDRVRVVGELKAREYENRDGAKGTSLDVTAWGVQPMNKGRNKPMPTSSAANTHEPGPGWGNPGQQQHMQNGAGGWDAPAGDPWATGGTQQQQPTNPPQGGADPWGQQPNNGWR